MSTSPAPNVDRENLLDFVGERDNAVLVTTRGDGRASACPITYAVVNDRLIVGLAPSRTEVTNVRRNPRVSICVLSEEFSGPWAQFDGSGEILSLPAAMEPLVAFYRATKGEHPDWDAYREEMQRQGSVLLRVTVDLWGPIASGGRPADVVNEVVAT